MKSIIRLLIKILSFLKGLLIKKKSKKEENYSINKKKDKVSSLLKHYEMIDALKEEINQVVEIHGKNLILRQHNQISSNNFVVKGKILEVDDHWIKMEYHPSKYLKVRGPDYLYFRTDAIMNFIPVQKDSGK